MPKQASGETGVQILASRPLGWLPRSDTEIEGADGVSLLVE